VWNQGFLGGVYFLGAESYNQFIIMMFVKVSSELIYMYWKGDPSGIGDYVDEGRGRYEAGSIVY